MAGPAVILVGEDGLCCALGGKIIRECLGWPLRVPPIVTGGITKFVHEMPRFHRTARAFPVVCIADTDGRCPAEMHQQLNPSGTSTKFVLRFAVTEAESWVLADAAALAAFLKVAPVLVTDRPDDDPDPKGTLLSLARRSRVRRLRQEMISTTDSSKAGTGYNDHLREFVRDHWNPREAMQRSPSLARAVGRIQGLRS